MEILNQKVQKARELGSPIRKQKMPKQPKLTSQEIQAKLEWAESNRQMILEEKIKKAQISASPRKTNKGKIFQSKIFENDELNQTLINPRSDESLSSDETDLGRYDSIDNLKSVDEVVDSNDNLQLKNVGHMQKLDSLI